MWIAHLKREHPDAKRHTRVVFVATAQQQQPHDTREQQLKYKVNVMKLHLVSAFVHLCVCNRGRGGECACMWVHYEYECEKWNKWWYVSECDNKRVFAHCVHIATSITVSWLILLTIQLLMKKNQVSCMLVTNSPDCHSLDISAIFNAP